VTGYVYNVDLLDPNTVVTLNGAPIYFDWQTGDFGPESFTLVNGLNIIEVVVTAPGDKHGKASVSVMYAQAEWPNDSWITDGIGFRATDLGLDQLEEVMLSYIDDLNIEEMIMSQNPVFDEEIEIWGLTIASAEANVTNVEYDQPTIEFEIEPQAIDTEASLPYIRLDFDVHGSIIGIGYSISGYVELTNILLDTFTWVWLDQDTHTIQFSIDQFSVNIGGFNMDISGFPDELEDLFEDEIRELIEDAAQDALWAVVPPLLEDLLASIPMEFSYPVGDATFYFAGQPQTLTLDSDGMSIWMNGRVLTDTLNPGVRPLNGSVRTDSTRPEMGSTVPNVGAPFGIGVLLNDDLVNQLLYQTYRSGMLHLDVGDAFNACNPIIYLILPQICDAFQPNPGDPVMVDVKIRPQLPPVMVMNTGKAGSVETEVQLGDLFIYLYADTPTGPEVALTLAASTQIPTEISHDYDTNTLTIEFGTITAVADTIDNPLDIPEGLFEDIAPLLIELLLPILDEALGGLQLPSFEIGGDTYKVQVEHILVVGSGLDYIGIYGAVLPGTF
jgi:hypothetical protein